MLENKLEERVVTKDEIWSVVMLSYLKMVENSTKGYGNIDELRDKLTMMKKSGLQSTSNYKLLKDKCNSAGFNAQLAEFIMETKETYPSSVILPWSELLNICNKYNLECAPLSGEFYDKLIPNENIEEMMSVNITEEYAEKYNVNKFTHVNSATLVIDDDTTDESEMSKIVNVLSRIPFITGNVGSSTQKFNSTLEFYGCKELHYVDDCIVQAPMKHKDWVICAPSEDIKEQTYLTIDTKSRYEAEKARLRVQDPLVGKFCSYGFIIFSKWGREATLDEVLKWSKL